MASQKDISVIMSSYNNEDTVLDAVNSILEQRFPSFELLVVNDGSADGTKGKLDSINNPRLIIIDNPENIGLTRSLNKAISMSGGRYIARQDADDVSMPGRLEKQFNYMETHPDVAVLGTGRATLDEQGKIISSHQPLMEPKHADLLKSNCFVHGSVMIRKEVLNDVGVYNEDFRFTQDYELWSRLSASYALANLSESLLRRRENPLGISSANLEAQRRIALSISSANIRRVCGHEILSDGDLANTQHFLRGDPSLITQEHTEVAVDGIRRVYEAFCTRYGLDEDARRSIKGRCPELVEGEMLSMVGGRLLALAGYGSTGYSDSLARQLVCTWIREEPTKLNKIVILGLLARLLLGHRGFQLLRRVKAQL